MGIQGVRVGTVFHMGAIMMDYLWITPLQCSYSRCCSAGTERDYTSGGKVWPRRRLAGAYSLPGARIQHLWRHGWYR